MPLSYLDTSVVVYVANFDVFSHYQLNVPPLGSAAGEFYFLIFLIVDHFELRGAGGGRQPSEVSLYIIVENCPYIAMYGPQAKTSFFGSFLELMRSCRYTLPKFVGFINVVAGLWLHDKKKMRLGGSQLVVHFPEHSSFRYERRNPRAGILDLLRRKLCDSDHVGVCCDCSGKRCVDELARDYI